MDWRVTLFPSSYSGLPSGESNNQVVNLNNLTLMGGEGTPVGSVPAPHSLLLEEGRVQRFRVMLFLNRVALSDQKPSHSIDAELRSPASLPVSKHAGARRQAHKGCVQPRGLGYLTPKLLDLSSKKAFSF